MSTGCIYYVPNINMQQIVQVRTSMYWAAFSVELIFLHMGILCIIPWCCSIPWKDGWKTTHCAQKKHFVFLGCSKCLQLGKKEKQPAFLSYINSHKPWNNQTMDLQPDKFDWGKSYAAIKGKPPSLHTGLNQGFSWYVSTELQFQRCQAVFTALASC